MRPTITQCTDPFEWDICGSDMVFSPRTVARRIFPEDEGLPLVSSNKTGAQFAYLFRRFGYPISGWDDYKNLVSYYLTTPDPDIILWCRPSSRLGMSFGYGKSVALAGKAERNARGGDWERHPIYKRFEAALTAAMTELLRPVYVRDTAYNILGSMTDEEAAKWERAEYSPQAGYGVGAFDPCKAD